MKNDITEAVTLSDADKAEFQHLLTRGLGRAVLFLQTHDATPYRDMILDACVHDLTYDPQCEEGRVQYMADIIKATGELSFYAERIRELLTISDDVDDQAQLFGIAGLLAKDGDEQARQAMYAKFVHNASQEIISGAHALIDLDGLDGFIFAAEHLVGSKTNGMRIFISSH